MQKIDLKKFQALTTNHLMRTEKFTPQYSKLGFGQDDIDGLIEIALDVDLKFFNSDDEKEMYFPYHAIQILGQLKTLKPFDILLERMEFFKKNDYYTNAVGYYFRKVGFDKKSTLIEYFFNQENDAGNRTIILETLETFVDSNNSFTQEFEETLVKYLNKDNELDGLLNALAIFDLVDLFGDKHIDLIRKVFKERPIDIFYDGDLEDIELRLGLIEQRSKPEEKNFLQKMMETYDLQDKLEPLLSIPINNVVPNIGRNDPCPCGSGKKYKKCCLGK